MKTKFNIVIRCCSMKKTPVQVININQYEVQFNQAYRIDFFYFKQGGF